MLAPEFPHELQWLNLSAPVQLAQLRGRVCALVFVNLGSTWSRQRLQALAQLRHRFGERLQVLVFHVPRFDHERDVRRIGSAWTRHGFDLPFAHDPDWVAWQQYEIDAWPTVLLIDGQGRVRERLVGDVETADLEGRVAALCGESSVTPLASVSMEVRPHPGPRMPLRFPLGLAVDGQYLYVADSGHHRILECDHAGRVLRQFGSGDMGLLDGPMEQAAFQRPHGLCLQRGALYVADSGNHAVRRIDLRAGEVTTLCGNGMPGETLECTVASPDSVRLDHPAAIALSGGVLMIACSGDNRLWSYDLGNSHLRLAAGSGELMVRDGIGADAAFAQPVALAAVQQMVYVCDAAGSAIRTLNARSGQVATLVGRDPWTYGRNDGARSDAHLQDPQAIALDPDAPLLWIADAGNDLLRTLRLGGGEVGTFPLPQRLHGACGLAVAGGVAWIADTDAHAVLRLDIQSGALRHVPIGE